MSDLRFAQRDIEAARIVREQIAELAAGDEDFIRDGMEGETNIRELIAALCEADAIDGALIDGIASVAKRMSDRAERIGRRKEIRRSLIASAMQIAELKKLETPAGTVFTKAVAPCLVVTEESEIPSQYFAPQPPKLDKKALAAALKDGGVEIPGAVLSNGGSTIQIRS